MRVLSNIRSFINSDVYLRNFLVVESDPLYIDTIIQTFSLLISDIDKAGGSDAPEISALDISIYESPILY